jgi:two-component system OmpR family sensor kinase
VTARPAAAARRRIAFPLRTKLVAVLVALLTLAFVLVAIATTIALHGFLVERLDQQLRAAGDRYTISLEHPRDHDHDNTNRDFRTVSGQAEGTLGARVVKGRVTAAAIVGRDSDDPAARSLVGNTAALATIANLRVDLAPHTIHLEGIGDYRVLALPGDDGDLLVTGLPTHPVEETIHRLVVIETIVYAIALVLAALGGAVLVRFALRPLNRMADTATRVAGLPLSGGTVSLPDRVPDADERTEVGQLTGAFNHMLEHVETSLQQRQAGEERLRRFIGDASHELRTPISVIRAHAELAADEGRDLLPADVAHSLQRIVDESARTGHLVDDLLLLTRLNSGRPLLREDVDLTRLAIDAVSDARVAGPGHRWQLELPDEPISVTGDPHALHQVLANLLANARLHTADGTTVVVGVDARGVDGAVLTVSDDGPGIPDAVLPDIFERFVRGDENRSPSTGSSGLGLAIVDAIVRAHGGTIDVDSRPGRTSFEIWLPADHAENSQS